MQQIHRTTKRTIARLRYCLQRSAKVCKTFIRRFDPDPRLQEEVGRCEMPVKPAGKAVKGSSRGCGLSRNEAG
jgi:hypothetical protein